VRLAWTVALILAAVHVALAWHMRAPGIFSDQAVYVALGNALQQLQYRELFRVDLPAHAMYPPGYPLLLAAWSAVGGSQFDWLVLIGCSSTAAALLLLFDATHNRWGVAVALASLGALAFNPTVVGAGGWVLSEGPFMLWQMLALWAVAPRDQQSDRTVLAGAAAIAAALTRSAGVVLVAALLLYWLSKRRYATVLTFGIIATAFVGGWLAFTVAASDRVVGQSYVADAMARPSGPGLFDALRERIANKPQYLRHLYWQLPTPGKSGMVADNLIGIPLVTGAAVAGVAALARAWPAAALYLALYGALLMMWPWTVPRFLIPIVPLVVLAVILGTGRLLHAVGQPRGGTAGMVVVAILLAGTGLFAVGGVISERRACVGRGELPSSRCFRDGWASYFEAVQHIRSNVAPDAVFVSVAPATLYYHTGHRVVWEVAALRTTPSDFVPFLKGHSVTHILLSTVESSFKSLADRVRFNCHQLELEESFPPGAYLFRIPSQGESADATAACQTTEEFARMP
jgi:hypothetical protein